MFVHRTTHVHATLAQEKAVWSWWARGLKQYISYYCKFRYIHIIYISYLSIYLSFYVETSSDLLILVDFMYVRRGADDLRASARGWPALCGAHPGASATTGHRGA